MNDESELETEEDRKNDEWLKANFIDLIQKYPREWIAVMDRRVIANAGTKVDVENMADEVANDREYSVYFIPPTSTVTDVGYLSE